MTFKDKLIIYIFNKGEIIEREYNEHINFLRFHQIDEVDLLETIIRKTRKDAYNEILTDIMMLLSTGDREQFKNLFSKNKN